MTTNTGIAIAKRYRLVKLAGRGGMGDVYLAHDLSLGRQVAVKSITRGLQGNPEVRKRIERECRLHAALPPHPGIIALYDKIEENGRVSLILEYFEGETLAACLDRRRDRRLPFAAAADIGLQVLDALAHIHAHNILHRDIKPANVMVAKRPDGGYAAKLMDFGIAAQEKLGEQATRITMLAAAGPGSPAYMAPERIDPDTFGRTCAATDLYAVGIMLHEMVCGHPPFQGTLTEVFAAQLNKPPNLDALPPGAPAGFKQVLRKALNKRSADRYAGAAEMRADLEALRPKGGPVGPEPSAETGEADTAATMLFTEQRRGVREAKEEAIARTRARFRRRRRLGLECGVALVLAACLVAQYFLAPDWMVRMLPRPSASAPDLCVSGAFWQYERVCKAYPRWEKRMGERKRQCESKDFWRHEQLCRAYPGWTDRMNQCAARDFWDYKEQCSTYPRWQEMTRQCQSNKCEEYSFCQSYPGCRKQMPNICQSEKFWQHGETCNNYVEWDKKMRVWCRQGEYWNKRSHCGTYSEWLDAMSALCRSSNCGTYTAACASFGLTCKQPTSQPRPTRPHGGHDGNEPKPDPKPPVVKPKPDPKPPVVEPKPDPKPPSKPKPGPKLSPKPKSGPKPPPKPKSGPKPGGVKPPKPKPDFPGRWN